MKKKDFSVLFKELIDSIDISISVSGSSISGSEVTFFTSNTKWLRLGKTISGLNISNVLEEGKITALVKDQSFTLNNINIISDIKPQNLFLLLEQN